LSILKEGIIYQIELQINEETEELLSHNRSFTYPYEFPISFWRKIDDDIYETAYPLPFFELRRQFAPDEEINRRFSITADETGNKSYLLQSSGFFS
jgi:hypothetical protein